jgi:hypothetical protein
MADEMPLSDDARQAGFGFASYLLVLSLIDKLVQTIIPAGRTPPHPRHRTRSRLGGVRS